MAKQLAEDYLVRAETSCNNHIAFLPLLEHFLLASGLLLRDIHSAFFSLHDPDDAEPLTMPEYVQRTQLDLAYAVRVEKAVKTVFDQLSKSLFVTAPSSSSPLQPPLPQGEGASTHIGGPDHPILPWSANLQLRDTEGNHQHKKDQFSKRPRSPERPASGSGNNDGTGDGEKAKKRRKPVPAKPRADAFSRSFDPPPLPANATTGKKSKRPLSPDLTPAAAQDNSQASTAPARSKRHKPMTTSPTAEEVSLGDMDVRKSGRLRGKERVIYTKNGIIGRD